MRWRSLQTAAARHLLELVDKQHLVDVAHDALEQGIYARGLGEIVADRDPYRTDTARYFEWAVRELGILVEDKSRAIDLLTHAHIIPMLEGIVEPFHAVTSAYDDYRSLQFERKLSLDALAEFARLRYWHYEFYDQDSTHSDPETFNRTCLEAGRKWCRERWSPFFIPEWKTSSVIGLAKAISEEKAFELLPIFADALQDAGCEIDAILNHCREDRDHVTSCWVVDLLLGKL